jgi:uncharacterized membrane-anchored protein YitT (DUF2179 family)
MAHWNCSTLARIAWHSTFVAFLIASLFSWGGPITAFVIWTLVALPLFVATWIWLKVQKRSLPAGEITIVCLLWLALSMLFLPANFEEMPSILVIAVLGGAILFPALVSYWILGVIDKPNLEKSAG